MAIYAVLVGIDYDGKRAEPGDTVTDIPAASIPWLMEQNIITPADNVAADLISSKQREPKSPSKGDK